MKRALLLRCRAGRARRFPAARTPSPSPCRAPTCACRSSRTARSTCASASRPTSRGRSTSATATFRSTPTRGSPTSACPRPAAATSPTRAIRSRCAPGPLDTFSAANNGGDARIVWHFDANNTQRTFVIRYEFEKLAVAHDDVVDVNLRVWGDNWPAKLDRLNAQMLLPGNKTASFPQFRVYGHPASVEGDTKLGKHAAFLTAKNIPAHQWVEMRVLFPRSLLRSTSGARVVPGAALDQIAKEEKDSADDYNRDQDRKRIMRIVEYILAIGGTLAAARLRDQPRARAQERSGRRVRVRAARRTAAGDRRAAAAPVRLARQQRVRRDLLRPDPQGLLQVRAGPQRQGRLRRPRDRAGAGRRPADSERVSRRRSPRSSTRRSATERPSSPTCPT